MYKIISTKLRPYLYELIPPLQMSRRYPTCFQTFRRRTTFLENSFLRFTITKWNKLDSDIKNIDSHAMFRKKLLTFIRPLEMLHMEFMTHLVLDYSIDCVWVSAV